MSAGYRSRVANARDPAATPPEPRAPIKVSVVVPVFNPGEHIEALLASLRRQSLPAEEFEAIFVDDGSTDGTAERLDAAAAEVPNFRVVHIPNSGWPGRPRNVGIEAARGEYVQFVDNDDELRPQALERLHRFATRHRSDVVVGREIQTGRDFPYGMRLFTQDHPRITVDDERLLGPLTPHKLVRRQFVLDHGIRFPERPRIFEDYAFLMHAYLVADVVSVLSGYACYVWKQHEDRSNTGASSYGRGYRDVIDAIHRHASSAEQRDRLLAHWYERRVLMMADARWADSEPERAQERFGRWGAAAGEFFPADIDRHLPALSR